ncbi:MAG: FecR domain-containing protein [Gemmatimonadetes bacterium]|nr:FecR domain-containing protein [Gemmatimonadota bacterium]
MNGHDADSRANRPPWDGQPDAEALGETWERLASLRPEAGPATDIDESWARLSGRLFGAEKVAGAPGAGAAVVPLRRRPWLRAAAAIAAVAIGGSALWSTVPASATAAAGERVSIVLPAGTRVDLNAGSTLRWSRGFAWLPGIERGARDVQLDGEAFFDVTPDGRPFRVESGAVRVRVLGTRFNVRSRPGEGTDVSVTEGRVEVREGTESVVLSAGQAVSTQRGSLRRVDATDAPAAWRTGGFSATDARLEAVIAELERHFSVRIGTGALSPEVLDRRVTLYYSSEARLVGVLDDVATALGLRYREVSGGWEVVPAP